MASEGIADAIRQRAIDVGTPRKWVGLWDFLLYAVRECRIVKVWFGDSQVDLVDLLMPGQKKNIPASAPVLQIVATKMTASGVEISDEDGGRSMNHWLAASELCGLADPVAQGLRPPIVGMPLTVAMPKAMAWDADLEEVSEFYKSLGLVIHKTVAQGDCGVDAIMICEGHERNALAYQRWRARLMEQMWQVAGDPEWQVVFRACAEDDPVLPPVRSVSHPAPDEELPGSAGSSVSHPPPEAEGDRTAPSASPADAVWQQIAECMGPVSQSAAESLIKTMCPDRVEEFRSDMELAKKTAAALAPARAPRGVLGQQVRAPLDVRLSLGIAFRRFCEEKAAAGHPPGFKNAAKQFVEAELQVAWTPAVKQRLYRARRLAQKGGNVWLGQKPRGRASVRSTVQGLTRKNSFGTQGRPFKAGPLREQLFAWFTDIRASIKGRLPTRVVMNMALQLRSQYVGEMLSRGLVAKPPKVDAMWLWRWKKQYEVSFRLPNRRYKVSRAGLVRRLLIFWQNNIRVRHYCQRIFGFDPGRHVDNADQKGWFMNEAGSKAKGTLEILGAPSVPLLENHADTRKRLSLMTWTTNALSAFPQGPPLEVCFKLDGVGQQVLDSLTFRPGPFSVRCSDSGSYREEHVIAFLELHLPVATEQRRAEQDWRLFYLDIYAGHLSRRIWDLCWSRMYVLLYHGGGCTGLTQPNDLWLHSVLETKLLELESLVVMKEQLLRPSKVPSLSRQQVLDCVCALWTDCLPHERSVKWTKKAGMSIALSGAEDAARGRCARQKRTICFPTT